MTTLDSADLDASLAQLDAATQARLERGILTERVCRPHTAVGRLQERGRPPRGP